MIATKMDAVDYHLLNSLSASQLKADLAYDAQRERQKSRRAQWRLMDDGNVYDGIFDATDNNDDSFLGENISTNLNIENGSRIFTGAYDKENKKTE